MFAASPATINSKPADQNVETATLEFWNRPIATFRSDLAGANPQDRVDRALQRLDELPLDVQKSDIKMQPVKLDDLEGVGFAHNGKVLFFLTAADVDKSGGETLASVTAAALNGLGNALQARESERHWPVIRRGLLLTLLSLALMVGFIWLVWKVFHTIFDFLHAREKSLPFKLRVSGIDLVPHIAGLLYTVLRVLAWLLTLASVYGWLTYSLGHFPYTEPWGKQLGGYVIHFFSTLALAAIDSLPGIFSCIVIFLLARWVNRIGKAFFRQVSEGGIRVSWMDADVAHATERIFTFIVAIFALVVAYPYIPGSSSDAFKGISVFFGLVVSLGSTGILNQVMSGLFVVYSRALKPGEWVIVGDKEGEVLEVGLLALKLRTVQEQEVTIPNSVIVNGSTTNFARLGYRDGMPVTVIVTIGYDAPWRQVHALLLMGAERTRGIRKVPAAYVLQRSLSDFYVEYMLVARLEDNKYRPDVVSELNANIQDAFNEYGVQIMSPHFMMQPQENIVVPRSKWHTAPAAPEDGKAAAASLSEKHFGTGV